VGLFPYNLYILVVEAVDLSTVQSRARKLKISISASIDNLDEARLEGDFIERFIPSIVREKMDKAKALLIEAQSDLSSFRRI
jgi:hypothetical protein